MKKLIAWISPPVIIAFLWWYYWHQIEHWIAYATGSYNTNGTAHNYNYNSGFGSIIEPPMITLLGIGAMFWWHHQCGVRGCYWYAWRKTDAGDPACWRHHPHKGLTHADLLRRHREASSSAVRSPAGNDHPEGLVSHDTDVAASSPGGNR